MTKEEFAEKKKNQVERGLILDKLLALVSQASKLVNEYEEYIDSLSANNQKEIKTN